MGNRATCPVHGVRHPAEHSWNRQRLNLRIRALYHSLLRPVSFPPDELSRKVLLDDHSAAQTGVLCQIRDSESTAAEDLFNPANLRVFASAYPKATLLVAAPDARPAFTRHYGGMEVEFLTLDRLVARITGR